MHDPNQLFVVQSISRQQIAVMLDWSHADERLTDEFCQQFAREYGQLINDCYGLEESEAVIYEQELVERFK